MIFRKLSIGSQQFYKTVTKGLAHDKAISVGVLSQEIKTVEFFKKKKYFLYL